MKKLLLIPPLLTILVSCKQQPVYKYTIAVQYRDCECPTDTIVCYGESIKTDYDDLIVDNKRVVIGF